MTEANPIYISFNSVINPVTSQVFMATLANSINKNHSEINVLLSTPGGSVTQGLTLYNFIRALPIPITMYNIGNVNSIGNLVFQAGNRRIAAPESSFMFHGVGFDVKNERLELSHLQDKMQSLKNDESLILDIMVKRTGMSREEVEGLFREMAFLNAKESLDRGISDEITEIQLTSGVPIQQLVFES